MSIIEPPNAPVFSIEARAQAIRAKWTVRGESKALDKFFFLPQDENSCYENNNSLLKPLGIEEKRLGAYRYVPWYF